MRIIPPGLVDDVGLPLDVRDQQLLLLEQRGIDPVYGPVPRLRIPLGAVPSGDDSLPRLQIPFQFRIAVQIDKGSVVVERVHDPQTLP